MIETNHIKHRYSGSAGEPVAIRVTANDTTHMVTYNLDDVSHVLLEGDAITFNLGDSGTLTRLQLIMDFNAEGRYDIEVENVSNCTADTQHVGSCKHTREGPPLVIENYKFLAQ